MNSDDFDDFEQSFKEMFERAESLGFKPLKPKDDFIPRVFGLRALHLNGDRDDGIIESDMYFAPKNNPVEMMMDYFMTLVDENSINFIKKFVMLTAEIFIDATKDGVVDTSECKTADDYAQVYAGLLVEGAEMLTKGTTWRKFAKSVEIDLPQVVMIGHPDALANMIPTSNGDLIKKVSNADVESFIKEVLTEEE